MATDIDLLLSGGETPGWEVEDFSWLLNYGAASVSDSGEQEDATGESPDASSLVPSLSEMAAREIATASKSPSSNWDPREGGTDVSEFIDTNRQFETLEELETARGVFQAASFFLPFSFLVKPFVYSWFKKEEKRLRQLEADQKSAEAAYQADAEAAEDRNADPSDVGLVNAEGDIDAPDPGPGTSLVGEGTSVVDRDGHVDVTYDSAIETVEQALARREAERARRLEVARLAASSAKDAVGDGSENSLAGREGTSYVDDDGHIDVSYGEGGEGLSLIHI